MSRTHKVMLAISVAATIAIMCWPLVEVPDMEKMRNGNCSQMEFMGMEGVSENSQLIAELQQGVDMLDKQVNKALDQAKERMKTVRLVPVAVTAYNPITTQTDSTPQITASNKRVKPGIVALSRDLEEEFGFKFGDTVVIQGHGSFVFEDRMNKRWTRRVDILMPSMEAAKEFGVRYSFLLVGKSGVTSSSVTQILTNPCAWKSNGARPIQLDYPDTFYHVAVGMNKGEQ